MGTVSIEIAGMRALVQGVESAIGDVPGDQSSVRSSLTRVLLSGSSVAPADHVVGWLEGEVAGLRRRLAMAVAIEASTPGIQSFVQFDESSISTNTPEQAAKLADQVAEHLEDGDFDDDVLAVLADNKVDPYFASAVAKQLSPADVALIAQNMNGRRLEIERDSMREPGDLEEFQKRYSAVLDGLGQSIGTATQQTGADLRLPSDYTKKWLDAMTGEEARPGQASWLGLVMSRGTFSTDFTVGVTRGLYEHERDVDMRGMWQMDAFPTMGSYVGAVDPDGRQVYDPLALALQAVGRNADASMELLAHGDTTTVPVDGNDVEVNAFMKYLVAERKWPVDDGQGAKEAIAAGMTPQLGGSTDSMKVAQFAKAVVDFKTKEIEDRAEEDHGWFSDIGHLVLDGVGLVPVIGEPADAVNGIWYYAQGNVIDGSLSMAAVIPGLGWAATGGKWTRKGVQLTEAGSKLLTRDGKVIDDLEQFGLLAKADNIEPGVFRFDDVADLNRAANNAHPGVVYQYKGMSWTTDEAGRVTQVGGDLKLEPGGRIPKDQAAIGKGPDARDTDVGFHLIGDALGGPTNKLNVLPGNGKPIDDGLANLNQGQYARMEGELRTALKDGKDVSIDIKPIYPDANTTRPDLFVVETTVNGVRKPYNFVNK